MHDHALAATEEASDRLSTVESWAVTNCAVHCMLTPLAGILPLIGLGVPQSPWFEWTLVGFAALIGGIGIGISYVQVHREARPAVVFVGGIAVLLATHSVLEGQELLHAAGAVAGATLILVAGRMNHSLVHACERCHPHPHHAGESARANQGEGSSDPSPQTHSSAST
jgi:hypothetical protein